MIGETQVELACLYGEAVTTHKAATVVLVTMRSADDGLMNDLREHRESGEASAIKSLTAVGDCLTPGLVSEAVFSAHEAAHNLDASDISDLPFRVEQVPVSFEPALPRGPALCQKTEVTS